MQRHQNIRSPPSSLHSSTLSLLLIFISSVHFYCRKIWELDKTHIFSTSKPHADAIPSTFLIQVASKTFKSMQPFGPILSLFDAVADGWKKIFHYHCYWSSSLPFTFIVTFTLSMNRLFRYSGHHMSWQLDIKTHTIFSIVKCGNQTRHIFWTSKVSRCYCYHHHHHHHCYNHQLTAVSFVGTVATVDSAVTHVKLVDTFPVWALPVGSEALPFVWTTNKVIAFSVTCKKPSSSLYSSLVISIHFCLHCIRLSHHFHSSTIFITFTHLESQFDSPISSVAFNVIVTSAHLHRYFTHQHYHFYWSSFK